MTFYDLKLEVEDLIEKNENLTDDLLDIYNDDPEECKKCLIEVGEIKKEIKDLQDEINEIEKQLENEIY
jgi:hypothetical protein